MRFAILSLIICLSVLPWVQAEEDIFPVRGIHFSAPSKNDVPLCVDFIRDVLAKENINTLILEVNYGYQYQSHPELSSPGGLGWNEVKDIVSACQKAKIRLIPMINCLGHQSWAEHTGKLLTTYPEFDETPGKYPNNKDIYCRSYCTLHPRVHKVMFDLIDELLDGFEADAFHVGLDEVFLIGEDACPRCQGKNKAELFAHEVNTLYNHLTAKKKQMWMWGDRLINGRVTGIGEWEASFNQTESAIDQIPTDIMICDWHYEQAHPTAFYFALKGFPVVSCPWRKSEVAQTQVDLIRLAKSQASKETKNNLQGMLHTTWCGMVPFIKAYQGEEVENQAAKETAACFKALLKAMKEEE